MKRLNRTRFLLGLESSAAEVTPAADATPADNEQTINLNINVTTDKPAGTPEVAAEPAEAVADAAEAPVADAAQVLDAVASTDAPAELVVAEPAADVLDEQADPLDNLVLPAEDAAPAAAEAPADAAPAATDTPVATEAEDASDVAAATGLPDDVLDTDAVTDPDPAVAADAAPAADAAATGDAPAADAPVDAATDPALDAAGDPVVDPAADAASADLAAPVNTPVAPEEVPVQAEPAAVVSTDNVDVKVLENVGEDGKTKIEIEVSPKAPEGDAAAAVVDQVVEQTDVVLDEPPTVATEDIEVLKNLEDETVELVDEFTTKQNEITEIRDEIETALDATISLESICLQLQTSVQNGGLNQDAARYLRVAAEQIYDHMGFGDSIAIPALEAFTEVGSRISASQLALEDIKEKVATIKNSIKEGFKKLLEWVKAAFAKLRDFFSTVKGRAERLQLLAGKLEGEAKKDKLTGGWVKKLGIKSGTIDPAVEVNKAFKYFSASFQPSYVDKIGNLIASAAKLQVVPSGEARDKAIKEVFAAQRELVSGMKRASPGDYGVKPQVDADFYVSPVFLGRHFVWASLPKSEATLMHFDSEEETLKVEGAAELSVLSIEQIKAAAKAVYDAADFDDKSYEQYEKLYGLEQQIVESLERVIMSSDATYGSFDAAMGATYTRSWVQTTVYPDYLALFNVLRDALKIAQESAALYVKA